MKCQYAISKITLSIKFTFLETILSIISFTSLDDENVFDINSISMLLSILKYWFRCDAGKISQLYRFMHLQFFRWHESVSIQVNAHKIIRPNEKEINSLCCIYVLYRSVVCGWLRAVNIIEYLCKCRLKHVSVTLLLLSSCISILINGNVLL